MLALRMPQLASLWPIAIVAMVTVLPCCICWLRGHGWKVKMIHDKRLTKPLNVFTKNSLKETFLYMAQTHIKAGVINIHIATRGLSPQWPWLHIFLHYISLALNKLMANTNTCLPPFCRLPAACHYLYSAVHGLCWPSFDPDALCLLIPLE